MIGDAGDYEYGIINNENEDNFIYEYGRFVPVMPLKLLNFQSFKIIRK